jgi:hypothetical protein
MVRPTVQIVREYVPRGTAGLVLYCKWDIDANAIANDGRAVRGASIAEAAVRWEKWELLPGLCVNST